MIFPIYQITTPSGTASSNPFTFLSVTGPLLPIVLGEFYYSGSTRSFTQGIISVATPPDAGNLEIVITKNNNSTPLAIGTVIQNQFVGSWSGLPLVLEDLDLVRVEITTASEAEDLRAILY